eukprot:1393692-Amorphochlora_amoeboformis.AAC.2
MAEPGTEAKKEHPLNTKWILYFHSMEDQKNWDISSYAKVYEIATVETFWRVFNNIKDDIRKGYWFLMREDIKPMWECPENENGGAWVFDVKIDEAEKAFLEAAMAVVGEVNAFRYTRRSFLTSFPSPAGSKGREGVFHGDNWILFYSSTLRSPYQALGTRIILMKNTTLKQFPPQNRDKNKNDNSKLNPDIPILTKGDAKVIYKPHNKGGGKKYKGNRGGDRRGGRR